MALAGQIRRVRAERPGRTGPTAGSWRQNVLPGFAPFVSGVPSWVLSMFDQTGAPWMKGGHGAPWALRLWVYACLSVPIRDRGGGAVINVRLPRSRGQVKAFGSRHGVYINY